jgi:wobble nucleotide-excising tRNase
MPNLARRLLEAFLAFRYPDCSGENFLYTALERVNIDTVKKNRILRLLNTHSHLGRIGDTNDDPWALSESGSVLQDVLDLIQQEDPAHFGGMVKRIGRVEADT